MINLRALRNANSFLQNQREISAGLVEKLLKLDCPVAERFYALYREQFNPDLTVPDSDWTFSRKSPRLIIKVKTCPQAQRQKQDLTKPFFIASFE